MYVRMSTDHQKYSTENQADAIREYAARYHIEIIATYEDAGKSGLSLDGRDALKRLIEDVQEGGVPYSMILVLDVTRWGRFQDADESAYYEYICRRAGIDVQYVAEQFENDGSPVSTIVKGVKRAMAGEYSRELSGKVFAGQCRLIELGYRQGGPAGYGLRRVLIDEHGNRKGELKRGEHKSLQTDRVVLVPGPEEEVVTVRWMYQAFTEHRMTEGQIAALLNQRGTLTDLDRPWTRGTVHEVLTNEKYIGNNVFNRSSFKLKKRRVVNAPAMWVRADGVFEAVVDTASFYAAQLIIQERSKKFSDEELLDKLRALQAKKGWLSGIVINETEGMPSSTAYATRFGSLIRAYQLIGYTPDRDYRYIEINRALRQYHTSTVEETMGKLRGLGAEVRRDIPTDLLFVNDELRVSLVICRCTTTSTGAYRWNIRLDSGHEPDITIAVRMDMANQEALDYYLLPALDVANPKLRLAENNGFALDAYRFDDLEPFFQLAEHAPIRGVA
ncbi:MAG: recombinase family protein [Azospirillum brasilense]|nr:MAG: recombinase family protein [Azospirillum brasilense]